MHLPLGTFEHCSGSWRNTKSSVSKKKKGETSGNSDPITSSPLSVVITIDQALYYCKTDN